MNCINNKTDFSKEPDNIMSLISEVKEILCEMNYGEGFIQVRLVYIYIC